MKKIPKTKITRQANKQTKMLVIVIVYVEGQEEYDIRT